MSNLLLDYAFKVNTITPASPASTGFLKKLCVVVKPLNSGITTGVATLCTTQSQIAAKTANLEAQQALNAGLSGVYILPMHDLNLSEALEDMDTTFYTVVISSDFDDENTDNPATGTVTITSYANLVDTGNDEITVGGVTFVAQSGAATLGTATFQAASSNNSTATSLAAQINAHADLDGIVTASANSAVVTIEAVTRGGNGIALTYSDEGTATVGATVVAMAGGTAELDKGTFGGVVALYSDDAETAAGYAAVEKQVGFYGNSTNKAKNMIYAFGKMLSNSSDWKNQQFITMPLNDGVAALATAETYFDDKISFVISDTDYGNRLALFAVGGKAIVAPYIIRNLEVDMQSAALVWISANQPAYTPANAALLQNELQKKVDLYISRGWIEAGTVAITLEESNFVASGDINVSEPNALWRVVASLSQTL